VPIIDRIDPNAIRNALVGFNVTRVFDRLTPGQSWSFAWTVNRLATTEWRSATIALDLVTDSGDLRPLWSRTQRWPLPAPSGLHPPPDAWPPWGSIVETPALDAEARALLYTGFGPRQLRVTLRPTGTGDRAYANDIVREIYPEPHVGEWATLIVPSVGDWNASYPIAVHITTDASAPTSVAFEIVEQDVTGRASTSYAGSLPRIPAGAGLPARRPPDETWTQGSMVHNWRWVVKPMYHADNALRQHQFSYVATLHWTDEFGNTYPVVTLAPEQMVVRVSDVKWGAAAAAELWFWFWVGVSAALAVAALSFGIASAVVASSGVAAAAIAARLATIAGIAGLLGSASGLIGPLQIGFWQEQADDPPVLDWDFWAIDEVPPEVSGALTNAEEALKDNSNVATGVAEEVARTTLLSCLAISASQAYGRVMGAQAAGSHAASKLQTDALIQMRDQLAALAGQAKPDALFITPPTPEELTKNLHAAFDQIAGLPDVPPDLAKAIEKAKPALLADCDRGAALLADNEYRHLVHTSVVAGVLSDVDGWLASI
jgi:hypothetical protein